MTYLVVALIVFYMLVALDKITGKSLFNTPQDNMRRVALSFIWPLTLLILVFVFNNRK